LLQVAFAVAYILCSYWPALRHFEALLAVSLGWLPVGLGQLLPCLTAPEPPAVRDSSSVLILTPILTFILFWSSYLL
jgi:hypothetical protein